MLMRSGMAYCKPCKPTMLYFSRIKKCTLLYVCYFPPAIFSSHPLRHTSCPAVENGGPSCCCTRVQVKVDHHIDPHGWSSTRRVKWRGPKSEHQKNYLGSQTPCYIGPFEHHGILLSSFHSSWVDLDTNHSTSFYLGHIFGPPIDGWGMVWPHWRWLVAKHVLFKYQKSG
jgi:hypothetical protein